MRLAKPEGELEPGQKTRRHGHRTKDVIPALFEAVENDAPFGEIDPFRRELHVRLGEAYEATGRDAEAALEYEVGAAVPPQLDRTYLVPGVERPAAGDPSEKEARGDLLVRAAKLRWALGERERARALLSRVSRELSDTRAAEAAKALEQEWR